MHRKRAAGLAGRHDEVPLTLSEDRQWDGIIRGLGARQARYHEALDHLALPPWARPRWLLVAGLSLLSAGAWLAADQRYWHALGLPAPASVAGAALAIGCLLAEAAGFLIITGIRPRGRRDH